MNYIKLNNVMYKISNVESFKIWMNKTSSEDKVQQINDVLNFKMITTCSCNPSNACNKCSLNGKTAIGQNMCLVLYIINRYYAIASKYVGAVGYGYTW